MDGNGKDGIGRIGVERRERSGLVRSESAGKERTAREWSGSAGKGREGREGTVTEWRATAGLTCDPSQ